MTQPQQTLSLEYKGSPIPGHLNASAEKAGAPVVIIVHEWWGLNEQIRFTADRLAAEGFITFAVDLFQGQATTSEKEAETLKKTLQWDSAISLIDSAVQAFQERDPHSKIGLVGFCMGGAIALSAASKISGISACISFYGIPSNGPVEKIKAKVQGHYARRDDHVDEASVAALEATLKKAGVSADIRRYDAKHGFMNETRPENYSAENAQKAWKESVSFFKNELRSNL